MQVRFSVTLRQFRTAQYMIVTAVLTLGALGYVVGKITGHFNALGLLRLLDVGSEQSIPTYVSVVNLLLASVLLFVIYLYEKQSTGNGSRYWMGLSILFLYLSVDEGASIHEIFNEVYQKLIELDLVSPTSNTVLWLPFGVFFVLVVFLLLLKFLHALPRDTRRNFLIAGGIFLTGALGFEYLGVVMLETGMVESRFDTTYLIRRLLEEGLEMYGIAFFNCALYREILLRKISVTIAGDTAFASPS